MDLIHRTGIVEHLDPADLYPATPEVFGALSHAVADAEQWIAAHRG
jgi:hypothetical protein